MTSKRARKPRAVRTTFDEGFAAGVAAAAKAVPTNWCDPLFHGENHYKWPDCRPVEALLRGIQDRIRAIEVPVRKRKGGKGHG